MYKDKKVLLIAGGGSLGTHTGKELLSLGCYVDVICLEDKVADHERLQFIKAEANLSYLEEFLKDRYYDGIVNYIHYYEVADYIPIHKLLTAKTDHLIFLSSYRVYADMEHPVTENAPKLLNVTDDEEFLATERYALAKAKAEKYLFEETDKSKWTVVRPVITTSDRRFDVVIYGGKRLLEKIKNGETLPIPIGTKNKIAGLDWAGNNGKIIAHLLFNDKARGEAFTISSAQNLTWGEVADIYTELAGAKFEWCDDELYKTIDEMYIYSKWELNYDRMFDRDIDNSKVLEVTGLTESDFTPIKEGIRTELEKVRKEGLL